MKNQEIWDNIAKKYQGYRRKLWKPVVSFLDKNKGLILDIGCGNFPTSKYKNIIGFDISLEQLKMSKGKRVQGDSIKLPFKSNKFDNVIFIASLHNLKRREEALAEANRVLKKDGKILISVWSRFQKKFFPRNLFTSEFEIPFGKYKRYYHLFTQGELEKLVRKTGFRVKKVFKEKNNIFLIGTKEHQR
ncbi:MAG: class I SAM-dependent methyltransferase [Candidatus Woesearchaeota archaeon]|nr:MAG: class I SAM-dependent methyltransferase [Candidatus Woesearchaeota archaeon]